MKHWMFRCDDVSMKLSQGLDVPQPVCARVVTRMHLWMCGHCSRLNRQFLRLREISRYNEEIGDEEKINCPPELSATLSPEARERIKALLRCEEEDKRS